MRPSWIRTKLFLDGGDPQETKDAVNLLGFLDGQTTNPTLIARNPEVKARLERGEKFKKQELLDFYKKTVREISALIPEGSVSIETYADSKTTSDEILEQAREMFTWISNAHIKMPTNRAGLEAAQKAVRSGIRVNMTLCFSQEQAAAVHMATQSGKKGDVFVSPFIGRLDDTGLMGVDLIENIIKMFGRGDSQVMVLAASVRNTYQLLHVIRLGVDIVTIPFKILEQCAKEEMSCPGNDFHYNKPELKRIKYEPYINFARNWQEMNFSHPLTDRGIELFSNDWNALIRIEKPCFPVHLL